MRIPMYFFSAINANDTKRSLPLLLDHHFINYTIGIELVKRYHYHNYS